MLVIRNLHKKYKDQIILSNFNLEIRQQELVCLIGKSGSGKSTLLKIIAGLEKADSGNIYFETQPLIKPSKKIGLIFQDNNLLPWKTVIQNIAFADSQYIKTAQFKELVELTSLSKFLDHLPKHISGGMKQKVSFIRALAADPKLILMDEPLSALDSEVRQDLRLFIKELQLKTKKSFLFVTHDQEEANFLGDRIISI